MVIVQETTQWATSTANNVYILNDERTKMIAYIPQGSTQVQRFKNPISFDRRGRTFELVK